MEFPVYTGGHKKLYLRGRIIETKCNLGGIEDEKKYEKKRCKW